MARCLEAALAYAAKGWAVLPLYWAVGGQCQCPNGARCAQTAKHPLTEFAPHGYQSATCDSEVIRSWFVKYPDCNIGLATGAISGFVVVDEDPRNGGDVTRMTLEDGDRPIPQSLRQRTGGGGSHTLLRYPSDGRLPDGERLMGKLGKGLDIKSDGGYIVAAPSIHASGREYVWEDEDVSVLEPMPDWMLAMLLRRDDDTTVEAGEELEDEAAAAVADAKLRAAIRRVRDGETRHGAVLWLAKQCRDNRVPRSVAVGVIPTFLAAANEVPGRHKFPKSEAMSALKWAYTTQARRPDVPRGVAEIAVLRSEIERHRAAQQLAVEEGVPVSVVLADVRRIALAPNPDEDWRQELIWRDTPSGRKLEPCVRNVEVVLSRHPDWAGKVRMNDFTMAADVAADSPLGVEGRWTDMHTVRATSWLQAQMRMMVTPDVVHHGVELAANRVRWHPVRAYLDGLTWDECPRLDSWIEDLTGADGSRVTRAMGRRFLLSAVARVRQPGCKVDHSLILEGPQNLGKSSLMRILFYPWFSDDIEVLGSKDSELQLRGVWCVEIAEMDAMHRSTLAQTKAFMSRSVDRFRAPYGRRVEEWPRQVVLCGSTNRDLYLEDETGNRRFWPVRCKEIDLVGAEAVRDQLWAEASLAIANGESWWLHEEDLKREAASEQEKRFHADAWEERISQAIEPAAWVNLWKYDAPKTIANVLTSIGIETARQSRGDQTRAGSVMRRLGYVVVLHEERGGLRLREYFRPQDGDPWAVIRGRRAR